MKYKLLLTLAICFFLNNSNAQMENDASKELPDLFIKVYGGISPLLSEDYELRSPVQNFDFTYDHDVGYNAGLSVGYFLTDNIAVQTGFETSENRVFIKYFGSFSGQLSQLSTKLKTNTFYLNGMYVFNRNNTFNPYVGVGASYINSATYEFFGEEFDDSGFFGFRLTAGFDYKLHDKWAINFEINNSFMGEIDFNEDRFTQFTFEFMPLTINAGVVYSITL